MRKQVNLERVGHGEILVLPKITEFVVLSHQAQLFPCVFSVLCGI